jgi:hypothetical protein
MKHHALNILSHVTLPHLPTRLGPMAIRHRQAVPGFVPWLLIALSCCTPVAALDEPSYALGPSMAYQQHPVNHRPIGTFFHVCLLIGGVAVTVSSNIIGPLMGISSVLWLMMRNDAAIDPRVSWM